MLCYTAIIAALFALSLASHAPIIVRYQWKYINYTWPSNEVYSSAKNDGSYVEENNIISGIKVWKDKLYLTVPRYRGGVPATLAVVPATYWNGNYSPDLKPYPNWDMQKIGNCSAFQTVQNMEIDPKGHMWILDSGRVNTMSLESEESCPPKLVILDLENNGTVLSIYEFPREVVNYNSSVLNDIVIDHEHGGVAYITDSGKVSPGLIVYSLQNGTSWKVHHSSMHYVPDAVGFKVDGINFADKVNIDGIALSPAYTEGGRREVYFTPLSSFNVFVVKTAALIEAQNKVAGEEREQFIGPHIKVLGRKPSQTEGMTMSNTGKLYFGLLADDGFAMWDSNATKSFVTGQKVISRDHHLLQWPQSFTFDDESQLWMLSNRMQRYTKDLIDIEQPNFRVLMAQVDLRNYQYYADGKAPEWPDIAKQENKFLRFGKN